MSDGITNGHNGMKAVEEKDFAKGIDLLTRAINVTESPLWLLSRSQAYQNTNQLQAALDDADAAYIAASKRTQPNSKSQMIMAQYRRSVILLRLGRPADSDACAIWSQQLAKGKKFHRDEDDVCKNVDDEGFYRATSADVQASQEEQPKSNAMQDPASGEIAKAWTRAYMLRFQAVTKLEKLPERDPGRRLTVLRVPNKPASLGKGEIPTSAATSTPRATPAAKKDKDKEMMPPPPVPVKKPETLRFDFIQTDKNLNITVYVKGAAKDRLDVQVASNSVTLNHLPPTSGNDGTVYLNLDGLVKQDVFSLTVTPNKVEVSLEKAAPGTKWKTWGQQQDEAPAPPQALAETIDLTHSPTPSPTVPGTSVESRSMPPPPPKATGPPAYPTSSKSGPKDWDRLEGADEKEDQDVNDFFKQIYKTSTPDQQRAMMKSFTESNGTALSTDWKDVSSRKVATHPPEGVEAKKW